MTQLMAWRVMSDVPLTSFVMLTVLSLARYLETDSPAALGWFVLWAVLAILTKGSGWAVGIFAVLAPLLSGRVRCLWRLWYVGAGVGIVALAAPFYLLTWRMKFGYVDNPVQFAAESGWESRWSPPETMALVAPSLWLVVVAGKGIRAVWRFRRGPVIVPVAFAWVVAQWIFLALFPLTEAPRFLMPSMAPAMVVFGAAMAELRRPLVAVLVTAAFLAGGVGLVPEEREEDSRVAAALVPPGSGLAGRRRPRRCRSIHRRAVTIGPAAAGCRPAR